MDRCSLVSVSATAAARQPPLPIWATIKDAYRHLWHHRWRYAAQLLVASLVAWALMLLADLASDLFRLHAGPGFANYGRYIAGRIATILGLILGGGTMFLSCGRAILFHRTPLIMDVLRVQRFGRFWSVLFTYWFLAHLGPTIASEVVVQQRGWGLSWLIGYVGYAGYWALTVPIATVLAMSMPVAAFEAERSPFRRGWIRSRRNFLRLAAVALLASVPTVAFEVLVSHALGVLLELFDIRVQSQLTVSIVDWLYRLLASLMSFIIILVLLATTLSAYARLSPKAEHVARVFD